MTANPWGLTDRQLEAARLASFYSHEEMAVKLGCSARTAKYLTTEVRRKMNVRTKRDIGVKLADAGLLIMLESV